MHVDEGVFISLADYAQSGELYSKFTDLKPPLLFLLYHWLSLGLQGLWAFHIFQILGLWFAAWALKRFLSYWISEEAAFMASFIFALSSGRIDYGSGMPERVLMPFIIVASYLSVLILQSTKLNTKYVLALCVGLLVGAASLIKQPGGLLGVGALACLLMDRFRWRLVALSALGVLLSYILVFSLIGISPEIIWKEAYAINFGTYMHVQMDQHLQWRDRLGNLFGSYGVEILALSLGGLWGLKKSLGFVWSKRSHLMEFLEGRFVLLSILIALFSIIAISLGGRFYSNYHIMSFFGLSCFVALGLELSKHRKPVFICFASLAVISNLGFHSLTLFRIASDQFKDWDSEVRALNDKILQFSDPNESIWINHGFGYLYHATRRRPAVKIVHFMHNLQYVDVCLLPDSQISGLRQNPNYEQSIQELKENKPRLIFWASRHKNSCTDRLKLELFPEVQDLLKSSYEKISEQSLGSLYRRRF